MNPTTVHKTSATILHKKSILKKTAEVGSSTLISRLLGLVREVLMTRYLGTGAISDAFFTAFKIPNTLRKIFAEGALSAAFIPTLVQVVRKGDKQEASRLMSLGFLIFEGFLVLWCSLVMWKAEFVLKLIVPGFSAEQIQYTIPLLRILMPFILFISSSALLAGGLQAVGHFFVPAFSPVLLNLVFIGALLLCMQYSLSAHYLCFFIILGGFLQLLCHIYIYLKLHFNFAGVTKQTLHHFKSILIKFLPCLVTMSITEVSLFISTSIASYLPSGSISLIYYAFRFMQIPLGVFAIAFSTILLPHLSRISSYAPKRLSFYLLETAKFVFWITVPATIMMIFFAEKIFHTIFLSEKFSLANVYEAQLILIAFLVGLFFFSLNKILLNMYYALHVTWIPTLVSLVVTLTNVVLDYVLMAKYNAIGLAMAATISIGFLQTLLLVIFLFMRFNFRSYLQNFMSFFVRYVLQLAIIFVPFFGIYRFLESYIATMPGWISKFMLYGLGFWFWVGPLCALCMFVIFHFRGFFNVRLYFLDLD
jgi:putative peptidoglycan lipid II flippase